MKKIAREYDFSQEQLNQIGDLARRLDLTDITARILYARGIDTEEKMKRFLSPSSDNFLSPYLMSGMKEGVELIRTAAEEGWNVAVFGDYDADGIGASAIMYRALTRIGIRPYLYIPERAEGYGMSVEAIDKIFDEFMPDLIITVDCGISNKEEVEYIKESGAYVIVTDHHELPAELPDCICINPKIADDYPYDNLCGAGVAFKLAQALIGEEAYGLLDFAALSTVADSVPLMGENRDIVHEGLKLIARDPRPAFSLLLGKNVESLTAQTLAFTVAPRINAAGRMGDAHAALRLFTTDDEGEIFELVAKLNAYNAERQKCCDEVYAQAEEQLKKKGAYGKVIMLVGEEWNTGFVGIVAARLAEEYGRPALLFVKNGNMLKGSARSIESVNIFDALRACSEYIDEFGGHAQAAGINLSEDKFDDLERALNDYIGEKYTEEDFIPKIYVTEELKGSFSGKLARELNQLEPYGMGNRKPLFLVQVNEMEASLVKPLSPHVSASVGGMDFMYFNGGKQLRLLESDVEKKVVFEVALSRFRGREYLKGYIRNVLYNGLSGSEVELEAFENTLCGLKLKREGRALPLTFAEAEEFVRKKRAECSYGLCMVASSRETIAKYPSLRDLSGDQVDVFEPSSASVANDLILSPLPDLDLSAYREIIFLDKPLSLSVKTGNAKVYVCEEICGDRDFYSLSTEREDLLGVYALVRKNEEKLLGTNLFEVASSTKCFGLEKKQFIFALAVFEELGLVRFENARLRLERGKRTELSDSVIYSTVKELSEV